MHEYYEKAKNDAREAMGNLIGQTVDDNLEDMTRALAVAKKCVKTRLSMAKAHLYFTSYVWAFHEIGAHGTSAK
jgi:hypothetical protein